MISGTTFLIVQTFYMFNSNMFFKLKKIHNQLFVIKKTNFMQSIAIIVFQLIMLNQQSSDIFRHYMSNSFIFYFFKCLPDFLLLCNYLS